MTTLREALGIIFREGEGETPSLDDAATFLQLWIDAKYDRKPMRRQGRPWICNGCGVPLSEGIMFPSDFARHAYVCKVCAYARANSRRKDRARGQANG